MLDHWSCRSVAALAVLLVACAKAPPTSPSTASAELGWGAALDKISAELAANLRYNGGGSLKVAVLDFSTPSGVTCELGSVLAEELTTRLFRAGRLEVIERRQLQRILDEQKMSASDLLDPDSAARLGKLLGAGGVVTGTITASARSYRLNARIILVESAALVSVADATASRADAEQYARCAAASSAVVAATAPGVDGRAAVDASAVYFENFANVPEGTLPEGWLGGSNLIVAKERGRSFLKFFQKDADRVSIQGIAFPDDFAVEVRVRMGGVFSFTLGDAKVEFGTYQVTLNSTSANIDNIYKQDAILSFERRGDVLRAYVNGTQAVLARVSGYKTPKMLGFGFETAYQWAVGTHPDVWRLYSIAVRKL